MEVRGIKKGEGTFAKCSVSAYVLCVYCSSVLVCNVVPGLIIHTALMFDHIHQHWLTWLFKKEGRVSFSQLSASDSPVDSSLANFF